MIRELADGGATDYLVYVLPYFFEGGVAETLDLEQRGPGDFFGVQQSGLVDRFRFARLAPSRAMSQARRAAERILNDDPGLRSPELAPLARMVEAFSRAAERA